MAEIVLTKYNGKWREKWDDFVMEHSLNGTFLHTRNFLEYHGERFTDASLIAYKGNDTIVAVIPACVMFENGEKIFCSHRGSTFGGIVIGEDFYNIEHVQAVLILLEEYLREEAYQKIELKCTGDIFEKRNTRLINYFLYQKGYDKVEELSGYIDFNSYKEDIISNFSASRRRGYRYAEKNNLEFKYLLTNCEIGQFYHILCENLNKFSKKPVHTLEELIEFKEKRLKDVVEFYGVYKDDELVAGSMVFKFKKDVFHTQYLAARQDKLQLFPMNFLNEKLIECAKKQGFRYFSFGISTEREGTVLNESLAEFKQGFGIQWTLNQTYKKML